MSQSKAEPIPNLLHLLKSWVLSRLRQEDCTVEAGLGTCFKMKKANEKGWSRAGTQWEPPAQCM